MATSRKEGSEIQVWTKRNHWDFVEIRSSDERRLNRKLRDDLSN